MSEDWEFPTLLIKIIDGLGNNRLFGFFYKSYIKALDLKGNERLLDFGSGSGAGSKHLARLLYKGGGTLTCVDTSRYWTGVAKKRMRKFTNVRFFTAPLQENRFRYNEYDAIYIFYALHDVSTELREGIVKEFCRILSPVGRLYIKEPQRANDGMAVSEIRRLMATAGFIESASKEKNGAFSAVYRKSAVF